MLQSPDLAWCLVDDRLVFLDVCKDRYFCLPEERNAALISEIRASMVPDGLWRQPESFPRPVDWTLAARTCEAIREGEFDLAETARALWAHRRIERRLATKSLSVVLTETRSALLRASMISPSLSERGSRCVRAFEQAKLLRSAKGQCLPRSLALALCLARCGDRPHVVLGVHLRPFKAHCWVQSGDAVLNDSAEEVLRYQPILII